MLEAAAIIKEAIQTRDTEWMKTIRLVGTDRWEASVSAHNYTQLSEAVDKALHSFKQVYGFDVV